MSIISQEYSVHSINTASRIRTPFSRIAKVEKLLINACDSGRPISTSSISGMSFPSLDCLAPRRLPLMSGLSGAVDISCSERDRLLKAPYSHSLSFSDIPNLCQRIDLYLTNSSSQSSSSPYGTDQQKVVSLYLNAFIPRGKSWNYRRSE